MVQTLTFRCKYCAQEVIDNQTVCLGCQLKRDFVIIAEEVGLQGLQRKKYVLYMNKRWALSEIGESCAKEWAERFKRGSEYSDSDSSGRKILDLLSFIC